MFNCIGSRDRKVTWHLMSDNRAPYNNASNLLIESMNDDDCLFIPNLGANVFVELLTNQKTAMAVSLINRIAT